uniref:RHS repeat-associated core domain-containing protein n=1 Tax=Peribacillus acanthi TaxID=2171554 RepID=UPI0023E8C763
RTNKGFSKIKKCSALMSKKCPIGVDGYKSSFESGVTSTVDYEYNNSNQLTRVGNNVYLYDDNGNLKSDGTKKYIFNDFNQLTDITDLNGNVIVTYTYDEDGKRKSTVTANGTVNYLYDGSKVLYETDRNGSIIREYTYDNNGQPLTITVGGKTYFYLFNHRGDVVALTDINNNVVASYSYDAWGNITSQEGPLAAENPYRYAGYRFDENTKMYYLMTRFYNPDNGVFLSHDPVKGDLDNPITQNGYNYGSNNPVMYTDPSGTVVETVIDLASIGYSTYQFIKNPTWRAAGYLIWDIAATAIPVVPGSYVLKGGRLLVHLKPGEVFLPGLFSFEQARNMAFKIMEKQARINLWNSVPRIGDMKISYGYRKVIGRRAPDDSWEWRVDWDPKKGPHINIKIGKRKPYKIAIPFKGSEKQYKAIIDSYNKKR